MRLLGDAPPSTTLSYDSVVVSNTQDLKQAASGRPSLLQSSATIKPPSIPSNLSFIVKVDEVRPNYQAQPNRCFDNAHGFFLPPNQRTAYRTGLMCSYRYQNGVFRSVGDDVQGQKMTLHKAVTVFSQTPDTEHLLTVPFDARTKNVSNFDYDWRGLTFEHKPRNNTSTYASLAFIGEEKGLPACVPQSWNRLVPTPYRYRDTDAEWGPGTTFAGLIALAAFSALPQALSAVLENNIRGSRWIPHNYSTGR